MKSKRLSTEQGEAALEEFGFLLVGLDQPGAPTPGRIGDRIHDICMKIEESSRSHDKKGLAEAFAQLRRLRLALDAWDAGRLLQCQ